MLRREQNCQGYEVRTSNIPVKGLVYLRLATPWCEEDSNRWRQFTFVAEEAAKLLAGDSLTLGPGLVTIQLASWFGGKNGQTERGTVRVDEADDVRLVYIFDDFLWSTMLDQLGAAVDQARSDIENVEVTVVVTTVEINGVPQHGEADPAR